MSWFSIFIFSFVFIFFFFKQKTAYEMRISDWSSDVCSSDLFANGYVANVYRSAAIVTRGLGAPAPIAAPARANSAARDMPAPLAPPLSAPSPAPTPPSSPGWDVFARPAASALVFSRRSEVGEIVQ